MPQNKVVVRYKNGNIVKGHTSDFLPNKDAFHVESLDSSAGPKLLEIRVAELKAVFFVKDFAGNPQRNDKKIFDPSTPVAGRKIRVVFQDGEELVGTTNGYQPGRPGFFLVPADTTSNIERCFVVMSATRQVGYL